MLESKVYRKKHLSFACKIQNLNLTLRFHIDTTNAAKIMCLYHTKHSPSVTAGLWIIYGNKPHKAMVLYHKSLILYPLLP